MFLKERLKVNFGYLMPDLNVKYFSHFIVLLIVNVVFMRDEIDIMNRKLMTTFGCEVSFFATHAFTM